MPEQLSPLAQVAAQDTPATSPLAQTGLSALNPDIMAQFSAQMAKQHGQNDAALEQRKGALETYQAAIREAPKARTSVDSFNAIGEGFYANPNFAWNPSAALASGFQRMNEVQDLRRKQAQEAPVEAAKVGYENYKDLSDKTMAKDLLTPASMVALATQTMRTQGSGLRQNSQQYQALFKINLEANIKANHPDAIAEATRQTDQMFDRAQARPDAQPLRAGIGLPPGGAPPAQVPPPPEVGGPMSQIPPQMRAAIMAEEARNPSKGPVKLNIAPTPGASPVQGIVPPPPAPGAPRIVAQPPVRGTPGLTIEEKAAQAAQLKGAEAGATEVGKALPQEGLKYYSELSEAAHTANDTKRVLNAVDNNLSRLEADKKVGKFADINKFIAGVKYAIDPDGSQGITTPQDLKNIASFEAAEKENFQLGISSAKSLSARATQMEFLKGLQNNPNAAMSGPGRTKIMDLLKQTADDVTHQHSDLLEYMKAHNLSPEQISAATPAQLADLTGHKNTYAQMQAQRLAARDIVDKLDDKDLTVPFNGKDITVKPYWSNKYRALVAKYPDGIRKINVGKTEE